MHSQFSKDEAQLVPLVKDYFMLKEMEQFEILSIESEELLDAMKTNSDSDDGKSEADHRDYTKVEENSSNSADQVFATSPQRDTSAQLRHMATMILDPFSSLIPGDKFPIGRILVVLVSSIWTIVIYLVLVIAVNRGLVHLSTMCLDHL